MVEGTKHWLLKQNVHKKCSERPCKITEKRHCYEGKGTLQKPRAVLWSSALFSMAHSQVAYVVLQIQGHFDKRAKIKCIIITGGKQSRDCISRQPVCFRDFPLVAKRQPTCIPRVELGKLVTRPCKGKGQSYKDVVKMTKRSLRSCCHERKESVV